VEWQYITKVGVRVVRPVVFRNYSYNYNRCTDNTTTSFTKLTLFFHKVSVVINIIFPLVRETLYAGRIKLCAEASELLTHAVSARRRPKNGVFGVHTSGVQKGGSRRVLNRDCGEYEGEQIQGADF
jgi:hypothetical protein